MVKQGGAQAVPPGTGVLLISSGRVPYLRACLSSLRRALPGPVDHICLVDTAQPALPTSVVRCALGLGHAGTALQVPGAPLRRAIEAGWEELAARGACTVLHVEEDFLFLRPLRLADLATVSRHPHHAQALLVRQRWYRKEFDHPSMLEFLRSTFLGEVTRSGLLELATFSFNPSVYDLARLRELAAGIEDDPTKDFEQQLAEAVWHSGLRTVVLPESRRIPDVLHLGAVVTTKHVALRARRRGGLAAGYVTVHGKRSAVVGARRLAGLSRRVRPRSSGT